MSKGFNKNGAFVDTGYLRDHISKLRREKKIASELYETVRAMKALSDPTISYQYDPILRDINQLIDYFESMARSLSHIEDEAIMLSHTIGALIENDTENTRHTASNEIML